MKSYEHIARRVFNRPHLVEPGYASVFLGALSDRLAVKRLIAPDGTEMTRRDLRARAEAYEKSERSIFDQVEGIAVIPVEGTLLHRYGHLDPYSGATGYDGIRTKLEAALDDPSVQGILLDIDSPGGEVAGCFDLVDRIYEARSIKPIWAVADEMACSAAYAIASAASRIVTPRTAYVGSVGVLTAHVDHSQMLSGAGLDVTLIYAGEHKVDGNPYEPLPADVRADIQAEIDQVYGMFARTVARNRGISEQAVRDTEARVYAGMNAGDVRFTDDVMPAEQALEAFDRTLREREPRRIPITSEEYVMNFLGLGRFTKRGEATEEEREAAVNALREAEAKLSAEAEQAEEAEEAIEESEAEGDDPPQAEDDAGDSQDGEGLDTAASAEQIVALCAEAKVDRLAQGMIRDGVTVAEARSRVANARGLRDAFAAAGLSSECAERAIESNMNAGFARELLTELIAAASGEEIRHHPPAAEEQKGRANLNVVAFYSK